MPRGVASAWITTRSTHQISLSLISPAGIASVHESRTQEFAGIIPRVVVCPCPCSLCEWARWRQHMKKCRATNGEVTGLMNNSFLPNIGNELQSVHVALNVLGTRPHPFSAIQTGQLSYHHTIRIEICLHHLMAQRLCGAFLYSDKG